MNSDFQVGKSGLKKGKSLFFVQFCLHVTYWRMKLPDRKLYWSRCHGGVYIDFHSIIRQYSLVGLILPGYFSFRLVSVASRRQWSCSRALEPFGRQQRYIFFGGGGGRRR